LCMFRLGECVSQKMGENELDGLDELS
jgi:hypothetical protein